MKYFCSRCRMTFLIEKPIATASKTTCAECGKKFWHGLKRGKLGKDYITIGITPLDKLEMGL